MKTLLFTAFNLTFIGLSFVVCFLCLFLLLIKIMSYIVDKYHTNNPKNTTIDEEAEFVIKNAIKQHIENV